MRTFEAKYIWTYFKLIINYIPATLQILAGSLILALIIGTIVAVIRLNKVPLLSQVVRVLVSYVRGTPVITQLFIIYFGFPQILKSVGIDVTGVPGFYFVVITYGFNIGAAVAENLRASLASVSEGQKEAAYAVGLNSFDTYRLVILPQAMLVAIPNFSNIFVAALKNTSLAFSVGIVEMMSHAKLLGGSSYHFLESYISVAIIYYFMYLIISFVFRLLERYLAKFKRVVTV